MLKNLINKCVECKSTECISCEITYSEVSELINIKNKINEAIELIQYIPGNQTNTSTNAKKLHKAYDKLYRVKKILE